MKKASDQFIKDKVRGGKELSKNNKSGKMAANKKARSLTPNTDEIIAAYPGSGADKLASSSVKSKDDDLGINVDRKKID